MNENLHEILNGTLLGDASIGEKSKKYFYYKHVAKDGKYLEWQNTLLNQFDIRGFIGLDNKIGNIQRLGFYLNSFNDKDLINLHSKWYIPKDGKNFKIVPRDIELTPTVLLHWYLGDGCLARNKENRIPCITFATNCFSKEDVEFLIRELKMVGLTFYFNQATSGFNKGEKSGYVIRSKSDDGTPYRFFKLIGLECPEEIEDCTTGSKGRGSIKHYFKNKWPTEEDWLRIFSNTNGIGKIIKEQRKSLGISQGQLAKKVGCGRNTIKRIERGVRFASVGLFRKVLTELEIQSSFFISSLSFHEIGRTED